MKIHRIGVVLPIAAVVAIVVGCNQSVTVNGLTWTRQNLNIETPDSWCYEDNKSNCTKYGRLYTHDAAKKACASMGGKWRLPTNDDWNNLINYAGGEDVAGEKLKSRRKRDWSEDGQGTDNYGFSALPGGCRDADGSFNNAGYYGYFWSATENTAGVAYNWYMDYNGDDVTEVSYDKSDGFSVRCVGVAQ